MKNCRILCIFLIVIFVAGCNYFSAGSSNQETASPQTYDVTGIWYSNDFSHVSSSDTHSAYLLINSDKTFEIWLLDHVADPTANDFSARGDITDQTNPLEVSGDTWFSVSLSELYQSGSWGLISEDNNIQLKDLSADGFTFLQDRNGDGDAEDDGDASATFFRMNPMAGSWIANRQGTDYSGIIFSILPSTTSTTTAYAIARSDSSFHVEGNDEKNLEVLNFIYSRIEDNFYRITAEVLNGGWDGKGEEIVYYTIMEQDTMYMSPESNLTTENALYVYDRAPIDTTVAHGSWIGNSEGTDESDLLFIILGDASPYTGYSIALPESQFNIGGIDGDDENNLEIISLSLTDNTTNWQTTANVINGGWDDLGETINYYLIEEENKLYMSSDAGLTTSNALFGYDRF
jgi:hypothetical protein